MESSKTLETCLKLDHLADLCLVKSCSIDEIIHFINEISCYSTENHQKVIKITFLAEDNPVFFDSALIRSCMPLLEERGIPVPKP